MKKYLTKLNIGLFILACLILPFPGSSTTNLTNLQFAVGKGWEYGTDDIWHLKPTGQSQYFYSGDTIQFFAQAGPIYVTHQWKLILYRNGSWYREKIGDRMNPSSYNGWNYSNFTPSMSDLPEGNYRVEYYLDSGQGHQLLSTINFQISYNSGTPSTYQPYRLDHAVTATGWEYGTGSEYLNYKPIGQRSTFNRDETVYLLAQFRNIYQNHRFKSELYKSGTKQWENSTDWIYAGGGIQYSNYVTSLPYAQEGSYEFRVYADFGSGFTLLATVPFTVTYSGYYPYQNYYPYTPYGQSGYYTYQNTRLSNGGWSHGSGNEYWNLRPIGERTAFTSGETVYAISIVRNIQVNHQWKSEVYRNGSLVWSSETPWRYPGGTWMYGAYYPYYAYAGPGNYEWKIFINTGNGWQLLDTKSFTVSSHGGDYTYAGATVAENWTYGTGSDFWNIQPVNPRTSFSRGANVFVVAQARNVKIDHRWRVETYRYNSLLWSHTTDWNRVGKGWNYSNFYPANYNSTYGDYQFKIYWDSGNGFELKDTKNFWVY